jgi:hypothetical protein
MFAYQIGVDEGKRRVYLDQMLVDFGKLQSRLGLLGWRSYEQSHDRQSAKPDLRDDTKPASGLKHALGRARYQRRAQKHSTLSASNFTCLPTFAFFIRKLSAN